MKKVLMAAALAAVIAAPAFAGAPDVFTVEVGPNGQFTATAPASSKDAKGSATWSRAAAPGRELQATPVVEDQAMPVKAKKKHKKKAKKAAPAPAAAPAPGAEPAPAAK